MARPVRGKVILTAKISPKGLARFSPRVPPRATPRAREIATLCELRYAYELRPRRPAVGSATWPRSPANIERALWADVVLRPRPHSIPIRFLSPAADLWITAIVYPDVHLISSERG